MFSDKNFKDSGFGEAELFRQQHVLYAKADSIDSTLKTFLSDSSLKEEFVRKGTIFLNNYISYQGQGSKKLLDFLNST